MAASRRNEALIVVGLSARALAQAARRAGFVPFAADLFADADTRTLAACARLVAGDGAGGFDPAALPGTIDDLIAAISHAGLLLRGLVYGSGFEAAPALLARIAAKLPLLGNPPAILSRIKDPAAFAAECARLAIPHPMPRFTPAPGAGWLEKRLGASGGAHIRAVAADVPPRPGHYLQRRVPGRPVSAFFIANGRTATIEFFSEQWHAPAPDEPFRYGGAVRPAALSAAARTAMQAALVALTAAFGLVGINSADFLLDGESWVLLEINPRPGATLDLAPRAAMRWHLASLEGRLPRSCPTPGGARAAAIFHAPRPIRIDDTFSWPSWARDRPPPGAEIAAGAPFCTLTAEGESASAARVRLGQRMKHLATRAERAP